MQLCFTCFSHPHSHPHPHPRFTWHAFNTFAYAGEDEEEQRGGGHATHFLATANTKAAAGSRLNWKGCGKEYETRRKKQARNKEERGGKGAANGSEIDVSVRTYDSNTLQGKWEGYIEVQKKDNNIEKVLASYRVSASLAHPTAHSLHLFFFYFMSQL